MPALPARPLSRLNKDGVELSIASKNENCITPQLEREIEKELSGLSDVSDDDADTPKGLSTLSDCTHAPQQPSKQPPASTLARPPPSMTGTMQGTAPSGGPGTRPKPSLMDVGKPAAMGAMGGIPDGPKDHVYEVVDGEARARVYDTVELRAAFLHYCNSSVRPGEMHLAPIPVQLTAQQFVALCKDFNVVEPQGPLSLIMLGIIYSTAKSDDDPGLSFPQLLDVLMELAFECRRNVAAEVQAEFGKRALTAANTLHANMPAGAQRERRINFRLSSSANGRSCTDPGVPGGPSSAPNLHGPAGTAAAPAAAGSAVPGTAAAGGPLSEDGGLASHQAGSRAGSAAQPSRPLPPPLEQEKSARFERVASFKNSPALERNKSLGRVHASYTGGGPGSGPLANEASRGSLFSAPLDHDSDEDGLLSDEDGEGGRRGAGGEGEAHLRPDGLPIHKSFITRRQSDGGRSLRPSASRHDSPAQLRPSLSRHDSPARMTDPGDAHPLHGVALAMPTYGHSGDRPSSGRRSSLAGCERLPHRQDLQPTTTTTTTSSSRRISSAGSTSNQGGPPGRPSAPQHDAGPAMPPPAAHAAAPDALAAGRGGVNGAGGPDPSAVEALKQVLHQAVSAEQRTGGPASALGTPGGPPAAASGSRSMPISPSGHARVQHRLALNSAHTQGDGPAAVAAGEVEAGAVPAGRPLPTGSPPPGRAPSPSPAAKSPHPPFASRIPSLMAVAAVTTQAEAQTTPVNRGSTPVAAAGTGVQPQPPAPASGQPGARRPVLRTQSDHSPMRRVVSNQERGSPPSSIITGSTPGAAAGGRPQFVRAASANTRRAPPAGEEEHDKHMAFVMQKRAELEAKMSMIEQHMAPRRESSAGSLGGGTRGGSTGSTRGNSSGQVVLGDIAAADAAAGDRINRALRRQMSSAKTKGEWGAPAAAKAR
mmetsp:Transcript_16366/g.35381  ORF Transcript_16366/g.35381 Transcript_16366/m.35381 type:complete len:933 (-) Transcript_16366:759-3557(-)